MIDVSDVLPQAKIDFYRENGFVVVEDLLSEHELTEFRGFVDEIMSAKAEHAVQTDKNAAAGAYYRVLNQRVNTWRDHAGMARYTTNPRYAEIARQLAGVESVRLFHDHTLLKMPEDSKPTPWHQDLVNWPMHGQGALSIWIALDDVDEHNGCMMFVPKSRILGKLNPINLVEPQEDIFDNAKGTEIEHQKPFLARLKAGSCTFHDGLTFHYAHPNVSEKPRRAFAVIYMPGDTAYNGKRHVVTDGLNMAKGEPFHGGIFPVLAWQ